MNTRIHGHATLPACTWLAVVLCGSALAQQSGEIKVPHPLPNERPVKGPSPATPPKEPVGNAPVPVAHHSAAVQRNEPSKANLPDQLHHIVPAIDPAVVYFDAPGDGALWARGIAYKAKFDAQGATYVPFLGSSAPRDYPVTFSLSRIDVGGELVAFVSDVSATRSGNTVAFDRGGVLETYEVTPGSMEQMFTFASLPSGGDLVVRMDVDTELATSETVEDFRFGNDRGGVSYGRAQAFDANGNRSPATTTWEPGAIELRVPESFLSSAAFPLTIDPFVTSFGVDVSSATWDSSPDVAFDATNGRYLVCWNREFSANDYDCLAQQHDTTGAFVPGSAAYIDLTTDTWVSPHAANNRIANNYLVVATVVLAGQSTELIRGRIRDAASTAMGAQFDVSTGANGSAQFSPNVGGDATTAPPTYYLVCWESEFGPGDDDIYARLVDANGVLQGSGPIFVDFSAEDDRYPSISKCDGRPPFSTQRWTITWQRDFNHAGTDHDIWGAQYLWDGSLVHSSYTIDFSTYDDWLPRVSSLIDDSSGAERDYMTVFERHPGPSQSDIHSRIFNGTNLVSDADISGLEGQGFAGEYQDDPSVDSDGECYAVAYSEQYSTGHDFDLYVSSVAKNGTVTQIAERHVNYDFSTDISLHSGITSAHSGGGPQNRFMLVWTNTNDNYPNPPTDADVLGGLYDAGTFASFCSPTGSFFDQVTSCPCFNPPSSFGRGCNNSSATGGALLTSTGAASLSADTVGFTASGEKPTATSVFVQGTSPIFSGTVFGQGVRCVGGSLKRLYVHAAAGGAVSAPVGTDARVHTRSAALGDPISAGSARYYFVYYRDSTVLGGCPATSTFNTTQTGSLIWYP